MTNNAYLKLLDELNQSAKPLSDQKDQYSGLIDKIGNARFVLIGEATHGTHEFYQARIEITKHLIEKKGFMAVAIEGDWPDAYRIHRYIQSINNKETDKNVLDGFQRFPKWMWRNTTLPPFINWLRNYNAQLSSLNAKVGFYGLDLYSLNASMQAVIDFLLKIDPVAAQRAQTRYACFDHLRLDPQTYGYLTTSGIKESCVKQAIEQLIELQHNVFKYVHEDGMASEDEYFFATQNARLVKDAEMYYRSMFEGHVSSWNVRDKHMAETLNVIADHLENQHKIPAKIIVWAHNSHVGDARATEVAEQGEFNIGQLVREQHDADSYLIGFSTYEGYVTAASGWGAPVEHKQVIPALPGSYEELFHHMQHKNFYLDLSDNAHLEQLLKIPRLQRAIGVIYLPDIERASHYYFSRLTYQFDSIIHFDKTTAVRPLDQ